MCVPWTTEEEGSFKLNSTARDEEDEVQEVRPSHPMGRDQAKRKEKAATSSASSANGVDVEALSKLMVNDPYNVQKGQNMIE
ncbi:hypothetical protein Tco_1185553 [Tanacetum coccineum]